MLSLLVNTPRDYAWGSTRYIAQLQKRPESAGPEAELWFGDHPGNPAQLADGRSLAEVTKGNLPYLLKLLAAASPLSIQVHPSAEQARAGFARDQALPPAERLYLDDRHKPEILVALSDFEAIVGMRPASEALELAALLGDAASGLIAKLQEPAEPERAAVRWALSDENAEEVQAVIAAIVQSDAVLLGTTRAIAAQYPGDPGVVVAMLMNHVRLAPGEALYTPPGRVHAYLSGFGVEAMAASDNVLRGGLTSKRIDVPEFLAVADLAPTSIEIQRADLESDLFEFDIPAPDFALRRVNLTGRPRSIATVGDTIILSVAGEVFVTSGDEKVVLHPGQAAFASADAAPVTLNGSGQIFITSETLN